MIAIDRDGVLERFALLSGLCEGARRYLPLCSDAAAEVERGERPGCPAEAQDFLTAAAAALANYRRALAEAGASGEAFSAGDVKISPGAGNLGPAKQLWREAAAAAAPYLRDGAFLFGRIPL